MSNLLHERIPSLGVKNAAKIYFMGPKKAYVAYTSVSNLDSEYFAQILLLASYTLRQMSYLGEFDSDERHAMGIYLGQKDFLAGNEISLTKNMFLIATKKVKLNLKFNGNEFIFKSRSRFGKHIFYGPMFLFKYFIDTHKKNELFVKTLYKLAKLCSDYAPDQRLNRENSDHIALILAYKVMFGNKLEPPRELFEAREKTKMFTVSRHTPSQTSSKDEEDFDEKRHGVLVISASIAASLVMGLTLGHFWKDFYLYPWAVCAGLGYIIFPFISGEDNDWKHFMLRLSVVVSILTVIYALVSGSFLR